MNSYALPRAACATARGYRPEHARYAPPTTMHELQAQRSAAERLARLGYVMDGPRDYRASSR